MKRLLLIALMSAPALVAMNGGDSQDLLRAILARKAKAEEVVLKYQWCSKTNGLAAGDRRTLREHQEEVIILNAQVNKLIAESNGAAQDICMLETVRAQRIALEKEADRKTGLWQNNHGVYTPDVDRINEMRREIALRKQQEQALIKKTTLAQQSTSTLTQLSKCEAQEKQVTFVKPKEDDAPKKGLRRSPCLGLELRQLELLRQTRASRVAAEAECEIECEKLAQLKAKLGRE